MIGGTRLDLYRKYYWWDGVWCCQLSKECRWAEESARGQEPEERYEEQPD